MHRLLRNNSLSLTVFGLFFAILIGQRVVGERVYNQDQLDHGETAISYRAHLQTRSFLEVTFENRESEFLQMAAYVLLTASLFQRGSVESKVPVSSLQTRQMCKSRPLSDLPTRSPLISSIRSSGPRTRLMESGLGT